MAYTQIYYHIVFRTFHSERTLEEAHERDLYMYVFATCKNKSIRLWRINSMPDHIHMFVSIPPDMSVAEFVKYIKQTMGNFLKSHCKDFPRFQGWANGYCAITYSLKERDAVIEYIKNQKEHHKRVKFTDEIRNLMQEAGIEIKEDFFRKDWEV